MSYQKPKQTLCLLTVATILLTGCTASEPSKILQPISSMETPIEYASSDGISSNVKSFRETVKAQTKVLPLSSVTSVNEVTDGQIFLGMTKKEVDKVFPHLIELGGDMNEGSYPNTKSYDGYEYIFTFEKNILKHIVYFCNCFGKKPQTKYNLTFNGKSKLDVPYTEYIKEYGNTAFIQSMFDDHIPYEKGIEKKLSSIDWLRYIFLKDGDTIKAMGVDDFENLDEQTANNMFVVDFSIDHDGTVDSIEIQDYMYGTYGSWTYGSWTGVHSSIYDQ